MPASDRTDVTRILGEVRDGQEGAMDRLIEAVYSDLKAIGRRHLEGGQPDVALQPTVIVHEAYLRLLEQENVDWKGRAHFFAIAGRLIRRVLVDAMRHRGRLKRGGGMQRSALESVMLQSEGVEVDLLALDEALEELGAHDAVAAQVVELRFFADQSHAEIASVLATSERTVRRHFAYAKAWLHRRLTDTG